jgi:hypothetical protein
MVAHVYNVIYLEGLDQEDHGLRPAHVKVSKMPSQQTSHMWWGIPVIPAMQEVFVR